jgi:hypothetical protein
MILALCLLAISIGAYSISQLLLHGKFKWMSKDEYGFFGEESHLRKYTDDLQEPPDNWYYRLIGSSHKERWFTSTWLTVNFTDGYHAFQSLSFLSIAGCVSLLTGIHFLIIWGLILLIHFLTYKILAK